MKAGNWYLGAGAAAILIGSLLGAGCKSSSTGNHAMKTADNMETTGTQHPMGTEEMTGTPHPMGTEEMTTGTPHPLATESPTTEMHGETPTP